MKTFASHTALALALAAAFGAPSASAAPAQYGMTLLDFRPISINNVGQVVGGNASDYGGATLYDVGSGVKTALSPPGMSAEAMDVNDRGDVILRVAAPGNYVPYVYSGGTATALQVPAYYQTIVPVSINNAGVIVATGVNAINGSRGFRYDDFSSEPVDMGSQTFFRNINNVGQIIGNSAIGGYVLSQGPRTYLPMGWANDINDQGHVVGKSGLLDDGLGVLYADGQVHTILAEPSPLLSDANNARSAAIAINNRGQVVGHQGLSSFSSLAFLYENGQATFLDSLIDAANGWHIAQAFDINDHGDIIGRACRDQGTGNQWLNCSSVLLQPLSAVPEPRSYALLLAGLSAVGFVARRRRPD